jgi:hypothetical protein
MHTLSRVTGASTPGVVPSRPPSVISPPRGSGRRRPARQFQELAKPTGGRLHPSSTTDRHCGEWMEAAS